MKGVYYLPENGMGVSDLTYSSVNKIMNLFVIFFVQDLLKFLIVAKGNNFYLDVFICCVNAMKLRQTHQESDVKVATVPK